MTARAFVSVLILAAGVVGNVRAADINVGPGRSYQTLAAGVAAAKSGDRLLLDAGIYSDDAVQTNVPLTIEGAGSVVLRATQPLANHKGLIVSNAALTVRNITFDGAQVTKDDGNNGAGIRHQAGNLTIENCLFTNNQDGLLINPIPGAVVTITGSTFSGNGAGDGYSHGIYANEIAQLTVSNSTFAGTKAGHDIKSRALATTVTKTVLDDGVTGTTSYAVDLPNGGVAVLDGIVVTQGPNTQNPAMIAYGAEGNLKAQNSLLVVNSVFNDQLHSASVVAVNNFTTVPVTLQNNTFQSLPTPLRGPGEVKAAEAGVSLRAAAIFSSAQTAGQSYFRIFNGGAAPGTVTVSLYNTASGDLLSRWQSPSIAPGASPQFPVSAVEAAGQGPLPALYSLTVRSDITGAFQHVLYRPADGVVSNLSTCDGAATVAGARLNNVHSTLLSEGFPSEIVVYNTGAAPMSAALGVFDARDGSRLGSYATPAIPALGEVIVTAAEIEAALDFAPDAAMYHYNLKIENGFTGLLQHLVDNKRAGLVTDMTAACALTN